MSEIADHNYNLSKRSLFLFKSLVQHFIADGQPVGSRTLARDMKLNLSPATIRHVMADLEDVGLLHSPHTSAGRVPTVKGYRLFVDSLLRIDNLNDREIQHIASKLSRGDDVKMLMEKTSSMLSEITRLAGVVMLPRTPQTALKQIEFMPLNENRILVILVMSNGEIQNRIIHTERTFTSSELQEAANYLNSSFAGKDLDTVRSELLAELQQVKEHVNSLMQTAIEMAQRAFSESQSRAGGGDDYVMSGQTNLMGVADLGDLEKLKRLFDTFNMKRDLLHILESSIQAKGVQIFIGEESGYEVMDDCSVVTSPYEVEGEVVGVLGVIGPTRMDYERVIPIVDITAKMLGSALNSSG
ncbi:MAG: heat-inducible transcriptional repressor HrcA [Gammaproteobacteria bacterium]